MSRPRVYVAGPYTSPDPCINTRRAIAVADELLRMGCSPFVPHLSHFWHSVAPKPYEDWLRLDLEWIGQCQALLRIPGKSSGADREVVHANSIGVPVCGDLEALASKLSLPILGRVHTWDEVLAGFPLP